jgi:hypothetical protein
MTNLFTIENDPKTVKGHARGYMTAVMYLAPYDLSGINICALADLAACKEGCLKTAGRGGMSKGNATFRAPNGDTLPDNAIQRARLERTRLFHESRDAFMARMVREIENFAKRAARAGLIPVVRPNGTSDIPFENIPCKRAGIEYPNIFAAFPEIQFYDYTKIPTRKLANIRNYRVTFSYSHRPEFAPIIVKALKNYGSSVNFAAVFYGGLPEAFLGRRVINGDESDLRFLDDPNVVVGLKAKGRARRDTSGFVVRLAA